MSCSTVLSCLCLRRDVVSARRHPICLHTDYIALTLCPTAQEPGLSFAVRPFQYVSSDS